VFVHRLDTKAYSYAYLPGEGSEHEQLFRRGKPLDPTRYTLHEPSKFQGRNLEERPVTQRNLVPGWIVADETPLYRTPSTAEAPVRRLPRHTPLLVARHPAAKGFREVRDEAGQRVLGFVKDDGRLRYWVTAPAVKGLAEGEAWIDIDVGQQMIGLRTEGAGLSYVTLISSGLPERPTPLGVFRVEHKLAYRSMGNLPHSADKYFIENIPWAMYFLPYYAIHGAYWHNEFGNRRSHGCVNLAPRDALYIYERVPPRQQRGFFKTFASERAPGAVVRVRDSARISDDVTETSGDSRA
jgi:lipoprotein-anchoring transpeptidase ErfK/SrfK